MEERNISSIRRHLAGHDAQKRIRTDIARAREDATVTIGRASKLFNFSESQLRDWETRGLLNPRRSKDDRGQRLYALEELDKLALLKELMEIGGYSPANIPLDINEIWRATYPQTQDNIYEQEQVKPYSIDRRVDEANRAEFWQYYVSQTLHIALSLIFEDIPETIAGIILPLERKEHATHEWVSEELPKLGACLIGWRDQDRTFHTFYQEVPSFDFPSDFRVRGLQAIEEEGELKDPTFVVIQRKARNLLLPFDVVEAVRRLLQPIYEDINEWLPCFINGPRDVVYSTTVLRGLNSPDSLLTFLTNRVIRLGGKNAEGKARWKFCCVLLPNNTLLSFQLRTLYVQAQSEKSPHVINKTVVSPDMPILSLSLRAFQSGHVTYRPHVSIEDKTIVYRGQESPLQSAIAFPIEAENGVPTGILYIVSEEQDAFSDVYQRILRLIARIVGELLARVSTRQKNEEGLRDTVKRPQVVNQALEDFASENKFIKDVGSLLQRIREMHNSQVEGETSFISIDIDSQSTYTGMYGEHMSINLSKALGNRIRSQMGVLFDKQTDYQIYHIYADRFFLFLNGKPLEKAREYADKLQQALQGNYLVSIMPQSFEQPRDRIEIKDVRVRLGVTSYKHTKLYDVLERYPAETRIADMVFSISYFLEVALNIGRQKGGGCIISWYPADPDQGQDHGRLDIWPPKE